ncbi:MAG: DUF1127 domain-containing protein [Yoonia sp.]|jgi:hypothetical protein|uniref:DUF1127 domain-containing protein n=1 Tax=Yoonia sp. TaxID=2212373 RepID=UPI00273DCFA0|nr:DUF1127 domain-containing protein [Yoonia sp.]MDP5084888.1 DUF1127 domain-containing protein [Yoonia sp.]MDP5361053.1 DUF1127 domain-containing protein [Paracoccaceae bacterium]
MSFIATSISPVQMGARLSSFASTKLAAFKEARARRAVYDEVKGQLSRMTDRDLADIGTNRLLIDDLAREAAYGKVQE